MVDFVRPSIDRHEQRFRTSCVPFCVEMMRRRLGRMAPESHELRDELGPGRDAGFGDYARGVRGVSFTQRFTAERDPGFPLDELFAAIRGELEASRFVLASLRSGEFDDGATLCHMWAVDAERGGQLMAISKDGPATLTRGHAAAAIAALGGADVLTYELVDEPAA